MLDASAYPDTFARDHLPPVASWPKINQRPFDAFGYPKRMNAAAELLDGAVARGFGARPAIRTMTEVWSYDELLLRTNQIAAVLADDLGLIPGNRVLLRAPNSPLLAACWLAVLKAGGIAVATMPLLRARELSHIIAKARVDIALCDARLAAELQGCDAPSKRVVLFHTDAADGLEARAGRKTGAFNTVMASHDDVALIAFTSGTTGPAKGTLHFHSDVLAICDAWQPLLGTTPDDVFTGSAPFAFTFGLGALLLFPLRHGASSVLLEQVSAQTLLEAMERQAVTTLFTVPTLYRSMTPLAAKADLASLRQCISSGEHLPASVFQAWQAATGHRIINSIGSTEMLHAFLAMSPDAARAGPVGQPLPGYEATVVDSKMQPVSAGTVGRLAVRGPTGCRYLGDADRQGKYVQDGWNLTGDAFVRDQDGFFWYHARTDDMIVSAGYNISGTEVEEVLLEHPAVRECAVVGYPDAERGQIVKAFIVLADGTPNTDATARLLQEEVRNTIAPYKYPRAIAFVESLPRTVSGKVQRNVLRGAGEGH
jgi:2-aminobenzoate-CoA ligase